MRALRFFLCAVVALGSSAFVAGQAQQPSPEQPTRSDGCKSYFALQPLDQGVLKSLATPIVPPNPNLFANESVRQLQEWDLPSKVTTWHDRPSPEELARRWDELNKKWNSATPGKSGVPRPYALQPLPPNDWKDLEKWFAKEGPKRISGMCVEPGEATYVLAVGVISNGGVRATRYGSGDRAEYQRTDTARRQDSSLGPSGGRYSPQDSGGRYDERSGSGSSDDPSAYTCAFLYRTSGGGGARLAAPDYYYCKAASIVPKSAVTTMLKYLGKTSLP